MKKLIIALFVLLFAVNAFAVGIQFTDPNGPEQEVLGYTLYVTDHEPLDIPIGTVGNPVVVTIQDSQFTPGISYSFYATCYNAVGESGPSNTLTGVLSTSGTWIEGNQTLPQAPNGIQFTEDQGTPITLVPIQ